VYEEEKVRAPDDNLSHALARAVRDRILSGQIPAGERINEVHLAKELEVSRTPLREALTRLAGEDFLEMKPRVGFSVRDLTVKEILDLYPIRATLDPWALRLSGIPPRPIMRALEQLNRNMSDAVGEVARIIEIDDRFHMELVGRCPNQVLLGLIRQMMWRTRRYEHLYFSEAKHVADAARTHRALLARLRDDDLEGACGLLQENMQTASPALLAAVEARSARRRS
jgi:DNA-binding GntR family transcriptional regulator